MLIRVGVFPLRPRFLKLNIALTGYTGHPIIRLCPLAHGIHIHDIAVQLFQISFIDSTFLRDMLVQMLNLSKNQTGNNVAHQTVIPQFLVLAPWCRGPGVGRPASRFFSAVIIICKKHAAFRPCNDLITAEA